MAREKKPAAPKRQKKTGKPIKQETEAQRLQREEQARRSRRRARQLLGVALTVLIIAGAVGIVQGGINVVQNLLDNTAERDEYTERVDMLVFFDVLPFQELNQVDQNVLKQVSIWGVYLNHSDSVTRNEYGQALISALEVDLYAADLFGPSFRFAEHTTFTEPIQRMTYEYNPETQMYALPITSVQPLYTGQVVEIQRESGGIKRVTVAYANTYGPNGEVITNYDFEHPARYMDFLFRRDGNNYYLFRLERSQRVPASASAAQPAASAAYPEPEDPEGEEDAPFSLSPPALDSQAPQLEESLPSAEENEADPGEESAA